MTPLRIELLEPIDELLNLLTTIGEEEEPVTMMSGGTTSISFNNGLAVAVDLGIIQSGDDVTIDLGKIDIFGPGNRLLLSVPDLDILIDDAFIANPFSVISDIEIVFGAGSDVVNSTEFLNSFSSGPLNDLTSTFGFTDGIPTTGGNFVFDFGDGADTLQFTDTREGVSVELDASGRVTVTQDGQGTVTTSGLERIEFTDGALLFDISGDNLEYVYRVYDAAFGRTPDEAGLVFWNNQINESNVTQESLAQAFVDSPEFDTLFPSSSDAAFVEALYQNALRRASDDAGQEFWTGAFATGTLSRTDMLVQFADSPENLLRNEDSYDDGVWVI